VALHSTVYNGLRQFLFVVPGLVLFAALGLVRLTAWVAGPGVPRRVVAVAGVLVALGGQGEALAAMSRLHPYEYAYFSPVVGGFRGAVGRYELDYWGECNKAAAQWVAAHQVELNLYPGPPATVAGSGIDVQYMNYLPADRFNEDDDGSTPDIYISSMLDRDDDPWAGLPIVHEVYVDGYPDCVIHERPELTG
jgi:hypothetical protein